MEINLLKLVREFGRKWYWLVGAIIVGWTIGMGLSAALEKRYSSKVIFVPEGDDEVDQGLAGLSLLTGKLGLGGTRGDSPFLIHFEEVVKTRNFKAEVRKLIATDSVFLPARRLFDSAALSSDQAFAGSVSPFIKTRKKDNLFHIEAVSPDSVSSLYLARALYRTYNNMVRDQKRRALEENLEFIQGLVTKNKYELDQAADDLRRFLEVNRFLGSPKLEQIRQGLTLKVKLEEEKYIITIKEMEALKIKKEKQDRSLTVIEDAYLNSKPVFPDKLKISAAAVFLALLLAAILIAFRSRVHWITYLETKVGS